jgi:hypothetical protein
MASGILYKEDENLSRASIIFVWIRDTQKAPIKEGKNESETVRKRKKMKPSGNPAIFGGWPSQR